MLLEVIPLPVMDWAFGFEPRVLVVARGPQMDQSRLRGLLPLLFGLTSAETEVALCVAEGQSPEAIAALRSTSIGTVRAQIRSLFTKLGVKRQSALVSRLNQLR
jgi:DNA-binding CsgD family transcriptional regulator